MGQEIERKFLVAGEAWRRLGEGTPYRQGYLANRKTHTVRVRIAGETGFLTVKGATVGATRLEFEYQIPAADAEALLDTLCERPLIEKTRTRIDLDGLTWEIDEFAGDNAGLIIAEVELEREDQEIRLPDWIGDEVTGDPRYYNANLIAHPFKDWSRC